MQIYRNIIIVFLLIQFLSCSDQKDDNKVPETQQKTLPKIKPPSSHKDTLKIISAAAVFYSPDSLQLQKIKANTEAAVFDADMHEYEFLFKTAHAALSKNFPGIKIFEAKNVRYILFVTTGKSDSCIDLDKNYDPYGLYLFNGLQLPHLADMANIDTELGFTFGAKPVRDDK